MIWPLDSSYKPVWELTVELQTTCTCNGIFLGVIFIFVKLIIIDVTCICWALV